MDERTFAERVNRADMSALQRKLVALTPVRSVEALDLSQLGARDVTATKGQTLIDQRNSALKVFVVETGWLYSYSFLPNGRRQIYTVYQAGDMIGFEDLSRLRNAYNVAAVTNARLTQLNPVAFREYLTRNVRLGSYLYAVASIHQNVIMDRMCAIARQGPEPRLSRFLLEIINRSRLTMSHDTETFNIPLSQELLADCVGMHTVHVSRTLSSLTRKALISRPSRNLVRLEDEPGLIALSSFRNRYASGQIIER